MEKESIHYLKEELNMVYGRMERELNGLKKMNMYL